MNSKKPTNRIFILIFAIILFAINVDAKEKQTPHFISIGGDVNGNLYFADFKQFEGVENCCTSFGNTFGFGYNIHAGYEYAFSSELFGMPWRIDLSFAYSDLSARFSETDPFANIIIGNNYVKGTAEFVLEPSVQAIIFDPGIYFTPIDDIPLSLRLGFQAAFLTGMTYYQEERLIKPEGVYYENGERVRGQYTGPIPNAESQFFALSFGARYKAADFGNFALYPSLRFNYGLTNLVNGIDWKASTLQGGVSLVYNFPKAEYPKPAPPPLPPLPEPTEPPPAAQLEIFVNTELNGKTGKEFEIPFTVYESRSEYFLLPYIFFKKDSDVPYSEKHETGHNIGETAAQSDLTKAAAKLLKENPDYYVTLMSNSLETESEETVNNRISKITNELVSYGIDISRIKVSKNKVKPDSKMVPELEAERIYIKLALSGGQDLIPYTLVRSVKRDFSGDNIISIKPEIKTSDKLTVFDGKIYKDKSIIKHFDAKGTTLDVNVEAPFLIEEDIRPAEFTIDIFAKNDGGAKANYSEKIKLLPLEERRNVEKNIIKSEDKTYSQYILCYFDFDGTKPQIVNNEVLKIIERAIAADKEIVLVPLTDNIGTEDYNAKLVEKRAKAAMNLLNVYQGKFRTQYISGFLFSNDTPAGRMLNRTVIVKIAN
jgi:outer membrane protein OmpA-like peptidoglycan-associated protein